ncbi:MAG: NAD(P)-dependent oxidoreductase [Armatimonadetes bacterium]|nr:NAD(P)-dependent oxidoreductase [Armatimonadota bacterium]
MSVEKDIIVVTGSSGTIGYPLCIRFGEAYDVVGFDRKGPPYPPPHADCMDMDLASDESVREGLRNMKEEHGSHIASFIHLAAYYDFSGEPSPLYEQVTVKGTERLLRGLQEFGFEVEQFVFSSTMLVHAPSEPGQKIDEEWPLEPKWPYPQSKVETETLMREINGGIPIVMLRIAGVYDDECHSIPLSNQILRIHERNMMSRVFPGDLTHGQAFLHLEDLIDLFPLVVDRRRQLPPESVFVIGEPETLSYGELQETFQQLIHGDELPTYEMPKVLANTGAWVLDNLPIEEEPFVKPFMVDIADDHYELDITRARTLLGWEPKHSLRATLPKMVAALKADPLGWYKEHELDSPGDLLSTQEEAGEGEEVSTVGEPPSARV